MSHRSPTTSSIPNTILLSNTWGILLIGISLCFFPACDQGQNQPPTADFSFTPENPRAGTEVTFTANGSDPEGEIQELVWHIPEQNDYVGVDSARGETFTNTFPFRGAYDVELTVRDQISLFDTETKTVDVGLRYSQTSLWKTRVEKLPGDTEDGEQWSTDGDPIIYVTITGPNFSDDDSLETSHKDLSGTNPPVTFDHSDRMFTDLRGSYTLSIWDEDANSSDDLIRKIEFNFRDNIACRLPQTVCYPSVDQDNEDQDDDVKRLLHFPPNVDTSDVGNADVIVYLSLNWSNP